MNDYSKEMDHELDLLRAEMMQNDSEITQYNCVLWTVISAVLAYAIQSQNYILCLLPYIIIFPVHFICESKRFGICRISGYLYVFKDDYYWAKRTHMNDKISGNLKKSIWKFSWHEHLQYYFLPLSCSAASVYKVFDSNYGFYGKWIRTVVIVSLTILAIIIIKNSIVDIAVGRQMFIERFTAIKEMEQSEKNSSND